MALARRTSTTAPAGRSRRRSASGKHTTRTSLCPARGTPGTKTYIAAVLPGADLHYSGKHTLMDMGYSGSYLDYRQFSALNRWDQRAKFDLRQQESARLTWYGHVSGALLPSTDLIDLGGIPYRKTGAETVDGHGRSRVSARRAQQLHELGELSGRLLRSLGNQRRDPARRPHLRVDERVPAEGQRAHRLSAPTTRSGARW